MLEDWNCKQTKGHTDRPKLMVVGKKMRTNYQSSTHYYRNATLYRDGDYEEATSKKIEKGAYIEII